MARDIIADLWNTASESPRDLEIQQKIEWVKEATSEAIMDTFEGEKPITSNIHPTAKVHPTAQIDPSVEIPEGCEIGKGVVIEKGATLKSQVTIRDHSTIKEDVFLWHQVTIWDHSTIEENVVLWNQVTIWNHSTIEEWCEIWGKTYIWDHSTINQGATLDSEVTIWDNCHIEKWCIIWFKATVWKGSNLWDHSELGRGIFLKENVRLWNYVKIFGSGTTIGKKSVIWDNVSLIWNSDYVNWNDESVLGRIHVWENCIIKGTPNSVGPYAPNQGLRYYRYFKVLARNPYLFARDFVIRPNVIIDEKGKFEGFRTLDEKKKPRSLERILTSLSDIVFKDIK